MKTYINSKELLPVDFWCTHSHKLQCVSEPPMDRKQSGSQTFFSEFIPQKV